MYGIAFFSHTHSHRVPLVKRVKRMALMGVYAIESVVQGVYEPLVGELKHEDNNTRRVAVETATVTAVFALALARVHH